MIQIRLSFPEGICVSSGEPSPNAEFPNRATKQEGHGFNYATISSTQKSFSP